jgi:hypothetical protein
MINFVSIYFECRVKKKKKKNRNGLSVYEICEPFFADRSDENRLLRGKKGFW